MNEEISNIVELKISKLEYFKSLDGEEEGLKISILGKGELLIYTFWRITYQNKICATSGERWLLQNYTSPSENFQNLPYQESVLYRNLLHIEKAYLNSPIKKVIVKEELGLIIVLENSLQIQVIVNCRRKLKDYYVFFS